MNPTMIPINEPPRQCASAKCRATSSTCWKSGWLMRTGGFCNLCSRCGLAFEKGLFCQEFHSEDAGWRACENCKKFLHCGCIASFDSVCLLDGGGVKCSACAKKNGHGQTFGSAGSHSNIEPGVAGPSTQPPTQPLVVAGPSTQPPLLHDESIPILQAHHKPVGPIPKRRSYRKQSCSELLPQYWPRLTIEELQLYQTSIGGSNGVVMPLFAKNLTASDVSNGGRVVIPKFCAETYFPRINQPEGCLLSFKDLSGTQWVFGYRFRRPTERTIMYLLEGLCTWIHLMQLQAGDTVIFSRVDPEGTLVISYRKAHP